MCRRRSIQVRSARGPSLVAASTRTLMEVIQWEGVTTTLIADLRDRRSVPTVCAYRWCIPSPHFPPSWYVQRAPTADSESGTTQ